jgi:hypothetical protein
MQGQSHQHPHKKGGSRGKQRAPARLHTYPGLGSGAALAVDPDVLGHDLAILVELEVLGELCM